MKSLDSGDFRGNTCRAGDDACHIDPAGLPTGRDDILPDAARHGRQVRLHDRYPYGQSQCQDPRVLGIFWCGQSGHCFRLQPGSAFMGFSKTYDPRRAEQVPA